MNMRALEGVTRYPVTTPTPTGVIAEPMDIPGERVGDTLARY